MIVVGIIGVIIGIIIIEFIVAFSTPRKKENGSNDYEVGTSTQDTEVQTSRLLIRIILYPFILYYVVYVFNIISNN